MSLDTYANLRTALTTRLDTSGISPTAADDLFTEAEKRIYREIRVREMETAFSVALTAGVAALPSGYADLKFAYLDATPARLLQRKPPSWIYLNYPTRSASGTPIYIARVGSNFIFGPYGGTHTMAGVYFQKPATVVNATLTGVLLTNPDLLLYGALAEAEKFLGRETRAALWETRFQEIKGQVVTESDRENFSGGPLTQSVA